MRKRKKQNRIGVLIILLLSIGIGYAILTQDLTINGISKVRGNEWDIHLENIQSMYYELSEGDVEPVIDPTTRTRVDCTITLNEPGDYYEFTVDAVNAGTLDGMLDSVVVKLNGSEVNDTTNPLPNYLDYYITYVDGSEILPKQILEVGDYKTFLISVTFKRDISKTDLLDTTESNALSFEINYVQADNTATGRSQSQYVTLGASYQNTLDSSWNYYLIRKGYPVIATEELYEFQGYEDDTLTYTDDNNGAYYSYDECHEWESEEVYDGITYRGVCVKKVSIGENIMTNTSYQSCVTKNGDTICILPKWDCSGEYDNCAPDNYVYKKHAEAESKGYTCTHTTSVPWKIECTNDDAYVIIIAGRDDVEAVTGKTGEGYCTASEYGSSNCSSE